MEKPKYDVSICIPFANDYPPIYFTVNQIATLLVASGLTHEIIVCANNSNKEQLDKTKQLIAMSDFTRFHNGKFVMSDIPSNGVAANKCAETASGKYLCFCDSHLVLHPNIFTECIKVIDEHEDAGLVHSPITWTGVPHDKDFNFQNNKRCFQYLYRGNFGNKYNGKYNGSPARKDWYLNLHFHGTYNHYLTSPNPYPIAGCGHGFFMIKHDTWKKLGGYHTGQRAYGGREPFLTFKAWMYGYRNFTVPSTSHCHYNGARMYQWTDETGTKYGMNVWYRNVMTQAYSIGGDEWLDIIYANFKNKRGVKPDHIERLRNEAVASSTKERKHVLDNTKIEFNDLFKLWDSTNVFY